jgi:hypothetical protein
MNKGGHKNGITKAQREAILQAYLNNPDEGRRLAMSLGLSSKYAFKLADARGVLPKRHRGPETCVYWASTKAPVHLFPREYESEELALHVSENAFVDAAMLSDELRVQHMNTWAVEAYQRRLGARPVLHTGRGSK